MWDLGCVAASILFFAVAVLYTSACERLREGADLSEKH